MPESKEKLIEKVLSGEVTASTSTDPIFDHHLRYYLEDLSKRDYFLESTTPYAINIEGKIIKNSSWGIFLVEVLTLLLSLYPEKKADLFNYSCEWSKASMFSDTPKTNYRKLEENLYVNTNHTALHSCWLLQDLLGYFGVDISRVVFLIHRPPAAETSAVKEILRADFIHSFTEYLVHILNKSEQQAAAVIKNITLYLNPLLRSISKSYTDLFLFDNVNNLYNYVKKIKELIKKKGYEKKSEDILNACMDLLLQYYRYEKY